MEHLSRASGIGTRCVAGLPLHEKGGVPFIKYFLRDRVIEKSLEQEFNGFLDML
jgi:hypothetical protein